MEVYNQELSQEVAQDTKVHVINTGPEGLHFTTPVPLQRTYNVLTSTPQVDVPLQRNSNVLMSTPQVDVPLRRSSSVTTLTSLVDESSLAQAFQDSVALNILPVPEPSVFNGDPIQLIEWKASFMSLIDRKGISSADKMYYLKKYVGGPA